MNTENQWPQSNENKDKLTLDDVKFIFEQSDKRLKKTTEIGQIIVARTVTIISILTGLIIGIIGYIFSRIELKSGADSICVALMLLCMYLISLAVYAAKNIQGHNYYEIGREPKLLLIDAFFNPQIKDCERIKVIYISEIENNQSAIEHNKPINVERWKMFNSLLWCIVSTPILMLFLYVLMEYIFFFWGIGKI
jgi:hypothetical protein